MKVWGLKLAETNNSLTVRSVLSDTAAEQAGIAANDVLIAINNLAVNMATIEDNLQRYASGQKLTVHIFRDKVLQQLELIMPESLQTGCELEMVADTNAQQEIQRNKWLYTM